MLKKIEEINMKMDKLLVGRDYKLDDMGKEARNTNQRHAGLQHQAQQPRLAMNADVLEDKITPNLRLSLAHTHKLLVEARKSYSRIVC